MDRKEFLRGCATGLCACATACLPAAADAPKAEDWRTGFVKRRYAKLISLLSETLDEPALQRTLVALGNYCSAEYDATLERYRGDVAGFSEHLKTTSSGDMVSYDKDKRVITMTSPDRADCFCPLNGAAAKTPGVVCNCSLGWQQHSWEKVLGKKVRVDLKEAVLQGGKRCTFEIHILEA